MFSPVINIINYLIIISMTNLSKGKSARWNGKPAKQVKEKKIKKTKVVV